MSAYKYRRQQHIVRINGTAAANNVDMLVGILPAKRQVQVFGLKSYVVTKPASGLDVKVELTDNAGANICDVSVSAAADATLNASSDTFPITLRNPSTTDLVWRLKMDGAQTSSGDAFVTLDIGSAGIFGEP